MGMRSQTTGIREACVAHSPRKERHLDEESLLRNCGSWFLAFWNGVAQSAQQIAATKSLTAPAQQVITRLGQLNRIPDGQWRVHPGDLPHGESQNLDDSAWPIAKPGSEYSDDAVWFRQWIEIPKNLHGYDLTGANVWFQFQAGPRAAKP